MLKSRRARRIERRNKRLSHGEKLTLISMVDILTALLTFLLANSVALHNPPKPGNLELPQSTASQQPDAIHRVTITRDAIMVHEHAVISIDQALAGEKDTIPALTAALQQSAPAASAQTASANDNDQPTQPHSRGTMTIIADKRLPYKLIRKVMLTCTQANYPQISLVVMQKAQQQG